MEADNPLNPETESNMVEELSSGHGLWIQDDAIKSRSQISRHREHRDGLGPASSVKTTQQ
jgi:hypothetical protein